MSDAFAVYGLALDATATRLAGCGPGHAWITTVADAHAQVTRIDTRGHAYDVAFAPDGGSVVVCFHGGHVRRYGLDGRETHRYVGHGGVPDGVRKVVFHPDGGRLASVGEDRTLRIWDAATTEQLHCFTHRTDVNTVCWGPGPDEITTGSDSDLRVIDLNTRKARVRDTGPVAEVQHVDGRLYTAWGDHIRVLDARLEVLQALAQAQVSRIRVHGDHLFAASWSGQDAGVSRWSLATGARARLQLTPDTTRWPCWALALDAPRETLYVGTDPVAGRSVFAWPSCSAGEMAAPLEPSNGAPE